MFKTICFHKNQNKVDKSRAGFYLRRAYANLKHRYHIASKIQECVYKCSGKSCEGAAYCGQKFSEVFWYQDT